MQTGNWLFSRLDEQSVDSQRFRVSFYDSALSARFLRATITSLTDRIFPAIKEPKGSIVVYTAASAINVNTELDLGSGLKNLEWFRAHDLAPFFYSPLSARFLDVSHYLVDWFFFPRDNRNVYTNGDARNCSVSAIGVQWILYSTSVPDQKFQRFRVHDFVFPFWHRPFDAIFRSIELPRW